jgi:antitoxin HicB
VIKKNPHWGTRVDEFLSEEGVREVAKQRNSETAKQRNSETAKQRNSEAAKGEAVARVVAWQLRQKTEQQDGGG